MNHDPESVSQMIRDGLLCVARSGNLALYNYSQKTMWEKLWNPFLLSARGLVLDSSGRVIARPFRKFFNHGEMPETMADALPAETPELADKYDGSLIICFWNPEASGWQCVTRGCWDNEQTRYANEWIRDKADRLDREFTYLFELVAPWNRVVLIYDRADMVLLGRVHTESGQDCTYAEAATVAHQHGFTPVRFESRTIGELQLANTSIADGEGFVARYSNGLRVKVKYAEYVRLHKLLTGLSVKAIWEGLAAGIMEPPENAPDEFMEWWKGHKESLCAGFGAIEGRAADVLAKVKAKGLSIRKDIALEFVKHPDLAPVLFSMLDGKDYKPAIWKQLRPVANRVFSCGDLTAAVEG